jgi:AhpD family alkylhydroperoxidase
VGGLFPAILPLLKFCCGLVEISREGKMAHVHLVSVEEAQGEVKSIYDGMIAVRGNVPNLFQALGHSPRMVGPAIALALFAGADDSRVSARLKQLAYLAASRVNHCHYCLERHAVAGSKAGITEPQIAAILSEEGQLLDNPAFDDNEKLIIRYAEELTRNVSASPETLAAMRESFDELEFLEFTFVVATANMFHRLAEGLAIELEPGFERKH